MKEKNLNTDGMMSRIQMPDHSCIRVENGPTAIPKICIFGFECWHCAFDQWIEEMEEREEAKWSLH